jgi:Pyruvate/2-oxoacid:ferredoxin oxidoreductase gamma subunit
LKAALAFRARGQSLIESNAAAIEQTFKRAPMSKKPR